jgi:hypothetical protein
MKQTPIVIIVGAILFGSIVFWTIQSNKPFNPELTPTPSSSSTPSVTPTPTAPPKKVIQKPTPTPALIAQDVQNHQQFVDILDPLNRRLALDATCTSLVPSQVAYPNDLEIMLDNYESAQPRILTIGGRQYSIEAHSWIFITLHSDTLPAKLPIFCQAMELGQIDLLAK